MAMDDSPAKGSGGRPSKYDPAFCEQIVAFMAQGYSVAAFAGHIDVARSTINEWADQHPEFSEALSRGKNKRLLHWETDALRVAQKGGGPGTATIITFGLKNMGGEDWNAPDRVEMTGRDGAPLVTTVKIVAADDDGND